MAISTKTGDDGTSGLLFNRRVSKTDARLEACGAVDELNAALGLVRAAAGGMALQEEVTRVQHELVTLMGELALEPADREKYEARGGHYLKATATERLTEAVRKIEEQGSFTDWAMPGGTPASAACDFARTICRRAERRAVAVREAAGELNPEILRYLNRLSDLCWLWARILEQSAGRR